MKTLAALLLLLQTQAPFTRVTYCREAPRGAKSKQCLTLAPDGTGSSQIEIGNNAPVPLPLTLSPEGREKLLKTIGATKNLEKGSEYETKKKVADLGRKHVTLETSSGKKEASFNYSDLKEANALSAFFDGLLLQQELAGDLENGIRYERLSVPERLDRLNDAIKTDRIGDPAGLIPLLDRVIQDDRVLQYARENARQMKARLAAKKS